MSPAVGDSILWIGLAAVIGILGFFVMVVVLVVRFLGFLVRLLAGGTRKANRARPPERGRGGIVCAHTRCGHVNPLGARYCRRCGRRLRVEVDIDTYG